ncbi:MAG: DNA polymerase III subunit gamma/tau [Mogibacterium sp.]|nr:DNA polymerase III subunit gamma/tau [Mogibacterium sp.]
MQTALYRAERPEVFEDIIGQKHIVRILQNQLKTGTVSQAYLFAGTHGTGKTSTARILAKAVNCTSTEGSIPCGHCENCEAIREGRFVDCIELDAASNNGVEDLRAIVDMVKYPPSIGKYKVYIIDEVHMLSQAAENAFLKTLEEPPEHAIFILATTDPQKVRATIRSRCMELNFRRVTEEDLSAGMKRICAKRNIDITDDALSTIASRANGSVRDALSILEQCIAAGDTRLDRSLVLEYTGAAGEDFFLALTDVVLSGDAGKALIYIDEILKRGKDARQILKDWNAHIRDLMIAKYVAKPERIIAMSAENTARITKQAGKADAIFIESAIKLISEYINLGRYSERPRLLLETAAVKLAASRDAQEVPIVPVKSVKTLQAEKIEVTRNTVQMEPVSDLRELMPQETQVPKAETQGATEQMTKSEPAVQADPEPASIPSVPAAEPAPQPEPEPEPEILDPGTPGEMWEQIVQEVAANDRSFVSLVGHHSEALDFDAGELVISVRPGKIRLAEEKLREITEIARRLYGSSIIVTLRSGDPGEEARKTYEMTEQETAQILQNDKALNEAASDIEDLFGIKPVIES